MDQKNLEVLTAQISEEALRLGFERVGFAPALPPARVDVFRQWLDQGRGGTMTYLNRSAERRSDPRRVMDNAKTIITVGQSYFQGWLPDDVRHDPARGQIASYAWGKDYHIVLLEKLERLAKFVQLLAPSTLTKSYVDTGHILERAHGERAGIGFIGKNTLLIAPKLGSTFFLGEILTTLDLVTSTPKKMPSCGSCTKCLNTCPTHAFPAEYILDSNLCISYLTIEYKGVIPEELRSKIGNHIFGCDDCQSCCPWNQRFSSDTIETAYRVELERMAPLLSELAMMTEDDFCERYSETPVMRATYRGFLRNVTVALGNWSSQEAQDLLRKLTEHKEPLVRLHAEFGLDKN